MTLEELEKEVLTLKTQVNDQIFLQLEAHRKWMSDSYNLMLGWAGQKLPEVPEEPPWIPKQTKLSMKEPA